MGFFGLTGSKKKSKTTTVSNVNQDINNRFLGQDVFEQLFAGAGGAAANIDTSGLTDTANALFSSGGKILGGLEDIAAGTDISGEFQAGRITGEGSLADENIGLLSEDLGRIFSEQFLPAITGSAVATGTLGGGRQGVAEGAALSSLAREFQRGSVNIRNNELLAREQAARDLSASRLAGSNSAIAALPGQFGLAEAGALAPLSPFAALSNIIGDPTLLSSSLREAGTSTVKTKGTTLGFEASIGSR